MINERLFLSFVVVAHTHIYIHTYIHTLFDKTGMNMATLRLVWTCTWRFYVNVVIVLSVICLVVIRLGTAESIIFLQ